MALLLPPTHSDVGTLSESSSSHLAPIPEVHHAARIPKPGAAWRNGTPWHTQRNRWCRAARTSNWLAWLLSLTIDTPDIARDGADADGGSGRW